MKQASAMRWGLARVVLNAREDAREDELRIELVDITHENLLDLKLPSSSN